MTGKATPVVIRTEWSERLAFASRAALAELVDPNARVTGVLKGDTGQISSSDLEALAGVGLPVIEGHLYPAIEPAGVQRDAEKVFQLGSYDNGLDVLTGLPDPEGPQHLFITEAATGHVVKVSRGVDGYRVPVNISVQHFAEMAWRYYRVEPVLFEMQHSGTEVVPFAGDDEERAIKEFVWSMAIRVDPSVESTGSDGFWWAAIWQYL